MSSQIKDIENYLRTHKRGISSMEAIDKFGATRLSGIIWYLKHKKGLNIGFEDVKTKNRYGHTTVYRKYVLHD